MGFCCYECEGSEYICTAWDGKGESHILAKPNHNLVEKCPTNVKTCQYRKKKIPTPFKVSVIRG